MFHFLHTSFKDVENGKKIHQIRFDVLMVPAPKKELLNHLLDLDLNMVKRQRSPNLTLRYVWLLDKIIKLHLQDSESAGWLEMFWVLPQPLLVLYEVMTDLMVEKNMSEWNHRHYQIDILYIKKKMSILASIFFHSCT